MEKCKYVPYYMYYESLIYIIPLGIIPLSLLIYWNREIYRNMKASADFSRENSTTSVGNQQEHDLAKVLIGIVFVCFCCTSGITILCLSNSFMIKDVIPCQSAGMKGYPTWFKILLEVSHVLMVINSSVNMIIYCCLNSSFRKKISNFMCVVVYGLCSAVSPII